MMQSPPPQTPSRNLPRFLPTLTEVVRAPASAVHPIGAAADPEQIVQRVLQRLDGRLKASIQAAIQDMVREQMLVLEPIVMQEIEFAVRQAVRNSLSTKPDVEASPGAF